jgi:hypothetical protein
MGIIMTLYAVVFSYFSTGFQEFLHKHLLYRSLDFFHWVFWRYYSLYATFKCSKGSATKHICDHLSGPATIGHSLTWLTTAIMVCRLALPSCRTVAPVCRRAPSGGRHACIKPRGWMNEVLFLQSQLCLSINMGWRRWGKPEGSCWCLA